MSEQNSAEDEFDLAFAENDTGEPTVDRDDDISDFEEDQIPAPAEQEDQEKLEQVKPVTQEPEPAPDYKALFEKEQQRNRSWEGRIRKAEEDKQKAQAEAEALRQQKPLKQEPDQETDIGEDDDLIAEVASDYPEIHGAMSRLVKREVAKVMEQFTPVTEKVNKLETSVSPVISKIEKDEIALHFKTIRDAHSDMDDIIGSGKLDAWIEQQPVYLQSGMKAVLDTGTAGEAIDLLTRYKESTEQKPSSKKQDVRHRALGAMSVKSNAVSPPRGQVSKDDYDGAWDEF